MSLLITIKNITLHSRLMELNKKLNINQKFLKLVLVQNTS